MTPKMTDAFSWSPKNFVQKLFARFAAAMGFFYAGGSAVIAMSPEDLRSKKHGGNVGFFILSLEDDGTILFSPTAAIHGANFDDDDSYPIDIPTLKKIVADAEKNPSLALKDRPEFKKTEPAEHPYRGNI